MPQAKSRRPKGLRIKEIRVGDGEAAEAGSVVLVHYECFLPRGDRCHTTRDAPHPVQFEVGRRRVVPALDHGVLGMRVGGVRSVTVSPQLAYYERRSNPDIPEGAALRYEVELLGVRQEWDDTIYRGGPPGSDAAGPAE